MPTPQTRCHADLRPLRFRLEALLPALPAGIAGFVSHDATLAARLERAGTHLTPTGDVEIACGAARLRADTPTAVVVVAGEAAVPRPLRPFYACVHATRALREARLLRRRYGSAEIRQWRAGATIADGDGRPVRAPLALGGGATAAIGRRQRHASALEEIVAQAGSHVDGRLDLVSFAARGSGALGLGDRGVLRVGVGRTATLVLSQVEALERLHHVGDDVVRERVPRILAHGSDAVSTWSLETRLPGERGPAAALEPVLLADCIEFLARLHAVRGNSPAPRSAAETAAEAAAEAGAAGIGEDLVAVGRSVDAMLAGVARGFGHGDFWGDNLLVRGGRLVGVVDWSGGDAHMLPFLDLLHGLVTAERLRSGDTLGRYVSGSLLPRVGRGDIPEPLVTYGRAIGLDPDAPALSCFVLAYWLEQVRRQVLAYRGVIDLRRWAQENIRPVMASLG